MLIGTVSSKVSRCLVEVTVLQQEVRGSINTHVHVHLYLLVYMYLAETPLALGNRKLGLFDIVMHACILLYGSLSQDSCIQACAFMFCIVFSTLLVTLTLDK